MKVLISGGGIAGLAAAFWLERLGAQVTVLERAREYTPLGHYVALKSHGVAMVKEMGLLEACRKRELHMRSVRMLTSSGKFLRDNPSAELSAAVDGYLLIRRADLHAALYEGVQRSDLRFGSHLGPVRVLEDRVEADLPGGTESCDLLIGADGIHSATRAAVFGEGFLEPMGGHYLALTVDCRHGQPLDAWQVFFGRGQHVAMIPNGEDRISVIVYHAAGGLEPAGKTNADYRTFFAEAYRDFAEPVRRVLGAIDAHTYVFSDTIAMVKLPSIVKGRVALVGDAAHCPTFMSGMGSSLALQGAHTLATSLAAHPTDMRAALAAFETTITPIALGYQSSAKTARPLLLSRNWALETVRNFATGAMPAWLMNREARAHYRADT
jgi:2-polyprenyl-6-methoxyphenol hydroxylase-like FAD-dependent oxidoreductase